MSVKYLVLFSFVCFAWILAACNRSELQKNAAVDPVVPENHWIAEKMMGKMTLERCTSDSLLAYSAYLPIAKNDSTESPLFVIFDPQGRGNLPIEKYQKLADTYGFILAGSMNSKNGLPLEEANRIYRSLLKDIYSKYRVSKDRVYLVGLSGGARIAALIGESDAQVKGIIACGAGLSFHGQKFRKDLSYYAMAGLDDFNLVELAAADESLNASQLLHHLQMFTGKHEWPPDVEMNEAFRWMYMLASKNRWFGNDTEFLSFHVEELKNQIADIEITGDMLALVRMNKKMSMLVENPVDSQYYSKAALDIEFSSRFKEQKARTKIILQQEMGIQSNYARLFSEKDLLWWTQEIATIRQYAQKGSNYFQEVSYVRLLNYMSLVAFMYSDRVLQEQDTKSAEKYLALYELIDPENPDVFYLKAKLSILNNDQREAILHLQKAIDLGFVDKGKLLSDRSFVTINDKADFRNLVNAMNK